MFGCIASGGWHRDHCFDDPQVSSGVCGYGTAVGVISFLLLLAFLGLDALFDNISNVLLRKYVVIGDVVCSGKFLYFYFCQAAYVFAVVSWFVCQQDL